MEIIRQLGINSTAFIQFGIFICIFAFLNLYVFSPYYRAIDERKKRTVGGEDLAQEFHKKSIDLHSEYQIRVKEMSQKIKAIYEEQRGLALKEYDAIVSKARGEAQAHLEENSAQIAKAVQSATAALKSETSQVTLAITHKLLGK